MICEVIEMKSLKSMLVEIKDVVLGSKVEMLNTTMVYICESKSIPYFVSEACNLKRVLSSKFDGSLAKRISFGWYDKLWQWCYSSKIIPFVVLLANISKKMWHFRAQNLSIFQILSNYELTQDFCKTRWNFNFPEFLFLAQIKFEQQFSSVNRLTFKILVESIFT